MGCAFFAGFVNFCGDVSARALAAHGSVVILMERSDRKNRSCRRYGLCGLRAWDSFATLRMTETAGQNNRNGGAERSLRCSAFAESKPVIKSFDK